MRNYAPWTRSVGLSVKSAPTRCASHEATEPFLVTFACLVGFVLILSGEARSAGKLLSCSA
jgi:hypothetical protein